MSYKLKFPLVTFFFLFTLTVAREKGGVSPLMGADGSDLQHSYDACIRKGDGWWVDVGKL